MNRYLRFGLIVIALVSVLLLGLIIYFAINFDPNAYKPLVTELVREKKQRELRLDGDIHLVLFPSLGIELGPLALSEYESHVEFASAERVQVSLALLPLLRKKLEIDQIVVTGLKINMNRFEDGRINIADLLTKSEQPDQFKIDIEHVAAQNAALTFRDDATGRRFTFSDMNFEADRLASSPDQPADAFRGKVKSSFRLGHSGKAEVDVATTLDFDLTLDVDKQYYAVQGLSLESKGQLPGINRFVLNCRGDFSANVVAESVAAEAISMKFGASNPATNVAGKSGQDNLDIELHIPRLSLAHGKVTGDKIAISAKVSSSRGDVNGKLLLSGVNGNISDLRSPALRIELEAVKDDWTIHGTLESALAASLSTGQMNLPDIQGVMHGRSSSLAPPGIDATIGGRISIDAISHNAQADITGRFSDSTIDAKLAASAFAQPSINFDVNIDQLDLDRLLSGRQQSGENLKKTQSSAATEQWLGLSGLESVSVQGSVRISLLKAADTRLSNVILDIKSN
jgi:AsmA protein